MCPSLAEAPATKCPSGCRTYLVRRGSFVRKRDGQIIQRYQCSKCGRSCSDATFDPCVRQKKRDLNPILARLLTGGYSLRRAAWDLKINRKTVVRKLIFLGLRAREALRTYNAAQPRAAVWEFDDLETFEHTKCKPLSVTMAVEFKTRRILGFTVSRMPCAGRLAKISVARYGRRRDHRRRGRNKLFEEISSFVVPDGQIKSDQNPHYTADVKRHFRNALHAQFKGKRGCVTGQGELKRIGFDPLFTLNHTFAMMRANVNRLFRRTWCTTKRPDRLELHLALYALRHNVDLIQRRGP